MGDLSGWRRSPWSHLLVGATAFVFYGGSSLVRGRPLWSALLGAAFFALVFTLLFVWLARRLDARARQSLGTSGATGGVVSEGNVVVPLSLPLAAAAVGKAAGSLPRAQVVERSDHRILMRVGASWKSWGEEVEVQLAPESNQTRLHITSRPRLPTTLFDSGKNQSNVAQLMESLKRSVNSDE